MRKAKAQLELSLAIGVKEKKKLFYKYISSKRAKENLHPLVDLAVNKTTEDKEKAEAQTVKCRCYRSPKLPPLKILR